MSVNSEKNYAINKNLAFKRRLSATSCEAVLFKSLEEYDIGNDVVETRKNALAWITDVKDRVERAVGRIHGLNGGVDGDTTISEAQAAHRIEQERLEVLHKIKWSHRGSFHDDSHSAAYPELSFSIATAYNAGRLWYVASYGIMRGFEGNQFGSYTYTDSLEKAIDFIVGELNFVGQTNLHSHYFRDTLRKAEQDRGRQFSEAERVNFIRDEGNRTAVRKRVEAVLSMDRIEERVNAIRRSSDIMTLPDLLTRFLVPLAVRSLRVAEEHAREEARAKRLVDTPSVNLDDAARKPRDMGPDGTPIPHLIPPSDLPSHTRAPSRGVRPLGSGLVVSEDATEDNGVSQDVDIAKPSLDKLDRPSGQAMRLLDSDTDSSDKGENPSENSEPRGPFVADKGGLVSEANKTFTSRFDKVSPEDSPKTAKAVSGPKALTSADKPSEEHVEGGNDASESDKSERAKKGLSGLVSAVASLPGKKRPDTPVVDTVETKEPTPATAPESGDKAEVKKADTEATPEAADKKAADKKAAEEKAAADKKAAEAKAKAEAETETEADTAKAEAERKAAEAERKAAEKKAAEAKAAEDKAAAEKKAAEKKAAAEKAAAEKKAAEEKAKAEAERKAAEAKAKAAAEKKAAEEKAAAERLDELAKMAANMESLVKLRSTPAKDFKDIDTDTFEYEGGSVLLDDEDRAVIANAKVEDDLDGFLADVGFGTDSEAGIIEADLDEFLTATGVITSLKSAVPDLFSSDRFPFSDGAGDNLDDDLDDFLDDFLDGIGDQD